MIRSALALLVFAGFATAQPAGGPAKKLYLRNSTDVPAAFDVLRHEGGAVVVTTTTLQPGQDIELNLKPIKGDRVLVAGSGQPNRPWTVYGMSEFNANDHPFPTIGYVLLKEEGAIKLVMLLQGGAGAKALPEKTQGKALEEKDAKDKGQK